jgi:hypothetical protein
MTEQRKRMLHTVITALITSPWTIEKYDAVIFDIFDAAICTREEARDMLGMDAKTFSLGLRARRKEREISKVWP